MTTTLTLQLTVQPHTERSRAATSWHSRQIYNSCKDDDVGRARWVSDWPQWDLSWPVLVHAPPLHQPAPLPQSHTHTHLTHSLNFSFSNNSTDWSSPYQCYFSYDFLVINLIIVIVLVKLSRCRDSVLSDYWIIHYKC